MNGQRQQIVGAIGALVFVAVIAQPLGAEESNPYLSIADRNAFGLQDPPPPAPPPTKPEPPKPKATVRLAGITTLFSKPRALFEVVEAPGKPPEKPIILVGEKKGEIEVVSIDVEHNSVKILLSGQETNLVLEARKTPAPAAAKLAPGRRPIYRPPGVKLPSSRTRTASTARTPSTPSPTVITPGGSGASSGRSGVVVVGGASTAPAAPSASAARPGVASPISSGRRMPYRLPSTRTTYSGGTASRTITGTRSGTTTLRTSPTRTIPTRTTRTQTKAPSPAQQYLMMRANELNARQQGIQVPPIPRIEQ